MDYLHRFPNYNQHQPPVSPAAVMVDQSNFLIKNKTTSSSYNSGKRRKNTNNNNLNNFNPDYASSSSSSVGTPLKQRSQANARERDRTHSVNTAFSTLRTLIPTEPKDRKLSKIETLRLASSYISHLGTQLMAGPIDQPCLRLIKMSHLDQDGFNNRQVCTFCISHRKIPKINSHEEIDYPTYESSILLNPSSSSSTNNILISSTNNEIPIIFP